MKKTTHDGDCWIYAINGVCTCGYFHELAPDFAAGKLNDDVYDKLWEDFCRHESILHKLNCLEDDDFGEIKKKKEIVAEVSKMIDEIFPHHNDNMG